MFPFRRALSYLILGVLSLGAMIHYVQAVPIQFTLAAGQEITRTINLAVEDHVLIKIAVSGAQIENTINFYVNDPDGEVTEYLRQGDISHNFICEKAGNYTLRFSNPSLSEDKFITMNCEIEHYFFGIPQMLFMALVIVVICVVMVAVFVLMGKPH